MDFPHLIHVTMEQDGDDHFLVSHMNGLTNLTDPGERVAIYQRVEVGTVQIQKSFQPRKLKK